MARRPDILSDRDNWGDVLNEYLGVSLAEDGTIKDEAVAPVVGPLVTDALAADDTPAQAAAVAAASAVDSEIAGRNILEGPAIIRPVLALSPDGSADASGAVTPTNTGGVTTIAGTYGTRWAYTTTGQWIEIANSGYLSRDAGTVFVRAYFDAPLTSGQTQPVLGTSTDAFRMTLQRISSGRVQLYIGNPIAGLVSGTGLVADDTFVTLAVAWEAGSATLYINGVSAGTVAFTAGSTDPATLYTALSGGMYPYHTETHLFFAERLSAGQIATVSSLAAAHDIDTTLSDGIVTIPGSTLAITPDGGSGASVATLQSSDSAAHTLAVDADGVLSVDGLALAYRSSGAMTVVQDGANVTMISTIGAGDIAVEVKPAGSANGAFSFGATYLDGVLVHATTDDVCPIRANGDTVGGNHGWTSISSYAVAGHAKTTADLGSTWTDGTRTYTLLQISGDDLVFGHPYTTAGGVNTGGTTPPAATLTHVSGATDTTSVPITTPGSITQLRPAIRDASVAVTLDGTAITVDGTYAGDVLVVRESYVILDYGEIIDWAQANIGTSFEGQAGIGGLVRLDTTYTYTPGGVCTVATTLVALRPVTLANCGGVQSAPMVATGYTLYRHMPGVASKSGYDFGTLVDMTSYATSIVYGPADYDDPAEPPSWSAEWLDNGSRLIGFALGYLPDKGSTADASRASLTTGWDMRDTKKQYPVALGGETLAAGDIRTIHAFRAYLDPATVGDAVARVVAGDASGDYVMASYLSAVTGGSIAVDGPGRAVTAIKGDGLTASDTVGGDGVTVTVPSAGHATLKVTP